MRTFTLASMVGGGTGWPQFDAATEAVFGA